MLPKQSAHICAALGFGLTVALLVRVLVEGMAGLPAVTTAVLVCAVALFFVLLRQMQTIPVSCLDPILMTGVVVSGLASAVAALIPASWHMPYVLTLTVLAAALVVATAYLGSRREATSPERGSYSLELLFKPFVYLLAYTAVYGLVIGVICSLYADQLGAASAQAGLSAGLAIAGALGLLVFLLSAASGALDTITRFSLLAFMTGALSLLQPDWAVASFFILALGMGLFVFLFVRLSLDLSEAFGLPSLTPFGIFALFLAVTVLGAFVGRLARSGVSAEGMVFVTLVAVLAVAVVTVYGLSSTRRWTAQDLMRTGDDKVTEESELRLGAWKNSCMRVAEKYGLTPRESDVFLLLAKGRNAAYIEKTLFISNHTAKAHILNIYKKMDIHSLQELIDEVEHEKQRES